jgi:hypothetical protein
MRTARRATPSTTLLWDLDEHVAMMDAAGIDAAFLTERSEA